MNPSEKPHESFKLPPKGPGEQGFAAPEGYFKDFSARLEKRLEVETNPQLPDPELPVENKENIFVAPAGYFETLPKRVMAAIQQEEAGAVIKTMTWYQRPALQWAVAAAVTLLIVTGIALNQRPAPTSGFDDFSTEELLAMVEAEEVEAELIWEAMGPVTPGGFLQNGQEAYDEEDLDVLLEEVDIEDLEAALMEETL